MKHYILILLLSPLVFFMSCSSGGSSDVDPTVYSVEGVWEYDYWNYAGTNFLSSYDAYLFLCEQNGVFATEIWQDGFITNASTAGYFTVNDDNTNATFEVILQYDPLSASWISIETVFVPVTINKIDNNELDFSIAYVDGTNETIRTSKTTLDACLILNPLLQELSQ